MLVPVIKGTVHLFLLRGFGPNLNKQEALYNILKPTELMLRQAHPSVHVTYNVSLPSPLCWMSWCRELKR